MKLDTVVTLCFYLKYAFVDLSTKVKTGEDKCVLRCRAIHIV